MRGRLLRTAAMLVAVSALGAAAGTAHARNLSIRGAERGIRFTWRGFRVSMVESNVGFATECPVTMEGSFHSTSMPKINRWLVGYVNRARVAEASCRGIIGPEEMHGGEAYPVKMQFLTESLPWHLRYASFAGTLPGITSVRIELIGPAIRVYELPSGVACLYRSEAGHPMPYTLTLGAGRDVTAVRPDASPAALPLVSGIFCEIGDRGLSYSGDGALSSSSGTTVSISLI
jgi:hypothetical protein